MEGARSGGPHSERLRTPLQRRVESISQPVPHKVEASNDEDHREAREQRVPCPCQMDSEHCFNRVTERTRSLDNSSFHTLLQPLDIVAILAYDTTNSSSCDVLSQARNVERR